MKKTLLALAACAVAVAVSAKLPPPNPDPAAKAKAAETAAKAGWQAKMDAYELCKVQDRIAAKYGKHEGKAGAKPAAAKPAASAASGTPVASSAPPPCADPGPFAYNAPEQKPLETSGAHSPAGTAASPPSVRAEAAKIQPSGKTGKKK
jgi:hypothetical protein